MVRSDYLRSINILAVELEFCSGKKCIRQHLTNVLWRCSWRKSYAAESVAREWNTDWTWTRHAFKRPKCYLDTVNVVVLVDSRHEENVRVLITRSLHFIKPKSSAIPFIFSSGTKQTELMAHPNSKMRCKVTLTKITIKLSPADKPPTNLDSTKCG